MKKFFVFFICSLLCFTSCITKYYYDTRIVNAHIFPYPKPLYINTTNSLFIDKLLRAISYDTIHLRRLNRETEVEITKRIEEMHYESAIRRGRIEWHPDSIPLNVESFFLCGKLDLQPNVKSLVLLEYDEGEDDIFGYSLSKRLWLINIKEDKLYSIVWLDYYCSLPRGADVGNCVPDLTLKNKIFTKTETCFKRYSYKQWKSKTTAQYSVNENGYIEFVKPND